MRYLLWAYVAASLTFCGCARSQEGSMVKAQDRWSGFYRNAGAQLVLTPKEGGYSGTFTLKGIPLPLEAKPKGDALEGSVMVRQQAIPFKATLAGSRLTFTSADEVYNLDKVAGATSETLSLSKAVEGMKDAPADSRTPSPSRQTDLVGDWQSPTGAIRFGADGMAFVNGENVHYAVRNNVLVLSGSAESVEVPFELNGDTLTLTLAGQVVRLTRGSSSESTPAAGASGGRHLELVGKWCYQANVNAYNGGASNATSCFTLNPDGTYEYHGLRDSYNPNGGATGEEHDAGTWTATDTTITANSRYKGPATYRLQKLNHPGTGDPMLVLDGTAFVTQTQRPPWR